MCYNAVDRHVERGRGEQPAIVYDSPVTGTKQIITFRDLQDQVTVDIIKELDQIYYYLKSYSGFSGVVVTQEISEVTISVVMTTHFPNCP